MKSLCEWLMPPAFMLSTVICPAAGPDLSWPEMKAETRPCTRWWWFGSAVEDSSIAFRLEEMSRAGIGGVEITPVYGTRGFEDTFIDFLSPKWMQALSFAISEGKRLGMGADMITGTGWPFGGGPAVTPDLAATKAIFLRFHLHNRQKWSEPVAVADPEQKETAKLAAVMAFSDKGDVLNLTHLVMPDERLEWDVPAGEWDIVAVFEGKTRQKVKRAAPGGEGWVLDHFSRIALDAYLGRFTSAFRESGCPAPRHFFNDSYEVYSADWTPGFFDQFAGLRGYRLEHHLPELLGEGDADSVAAVKCDFRETVSDLLLENFAIPWTDWAHRMGSLTRSQAHGSPGNLIDLYGAADVPECESFGAMRFDIPGLRREREGAVPDAAAVLMKFASSAAHVNGRPFASAETFTWLTEHFRTGLSQCKPQLDQMFCAGVNRVFFHGTPYSPGNAPWPGWQFYASINFSPYNTIWRDIRPFTEYIARCQSFLQAGEPDNGFLVYWPLQDLWTGLKGDPFYPFSRPPEEWLVPTSFFRTVRMLQKSGYDADYASDRILANATIENGRVALPGGASYPVLVLPSCKVIPLSTAQKIITLIRSGATVLMVENLPSDVPGLARADARRKELTGLFSSLPLRGPFETPRRDCFGKGVLVTGPETYGTIAQCNLPREEIVDSGIRFIRRRNAEGFVYFFSNLNSGTLDGWVTLGISAESAGLFDPLTSRSGLARLRRRDNRTQVYLQLEPGESIILKTFSDAMAAGKYWTHTADGGESVELAGPWTLELTEGEPAIEKKVHLEKLVSWTELKEDGADIFAGTGKYSLTFNLPETEADEWILDLGQVNESARVFVNGMNAGTLWSLPFRTGIGSYLKPGLNVLEVEVTNTPANRIADLERRGVEWKIFYDINVVDRSYRPFDASGWDPMPSGLIGPVTLTPRRKLF